MKASCSFKALRHSVSLTFKQTVIQSNKRLNNTNGARHYSKTTSHKDRRKAHPGSRREAEAEREFLLSTFGSITTKRDANSYLSNYGSAVHAKKRVEVDKPRGVNLGNLYAPSRAIEANPVFTHQKLSEHYMVEAISPLHVAVVKIRSPNMLDDATLSGVAITISQLARLGLLSVIVVDCDQPDVPEAPAGFTTAWKDEVMLQCNRVARALVSHHRMGSQAGGARVVDASLGVVASKEVHVPKRVHVRGGVDVRFKDLIFRTLENGRIPVIPPLAYTSTMSIHRIQPDDAVLALTRELAGLTPSSIGQPEKVMLDRIIVLDPLGGLPTVEDPNRSHVFVNLEQEYSQVRGQFAQTQTPATANRYVKNLDLVQRSLALLPPTSSALITTPDEAAAFAWSGDVDGRISTGLGVGTRHKRNVLIHSLLTDKPLISSSLPTARLTSSSSASITTTNSHSTPATFLKRGMPLTIIPDPYLTPWTPPKPCGIPLSLRSDPQIDFSRLLHLIEDSFGRKLNVQDYLARIEGKVAGIIIAGEYEGGAILTWETPPAVPADTTPRPVVPYLDKFAVLRKNQGSGGVADVIFNAMVRDCLPNGVVWRSRRENPVNKWYFERSVGTWRVPDSHWTMFWTGNDISWGDEDEEPSGSVSGVKDARRKERWNDFVSVCGSIQASWADSKPPD